MKKIVKIGLIVASAAFFLVGAARYNMVIETAAVVGDTVTVIVDPGHGGEDGGASTADGVLESNINLDIALRLEQILAFSGLEPHMIRTEDISVYSQGCSTLSEKKRSDLKNRVQTINAIPNAVLLSIHQNHFSNPSYSGGQAFYATTEGSRELADQIQKYLQTCLDRHNDRHMKQADSVYLMNHISCTGVLVECGFLSNPEEAKRLQTPVYQKKLVCTLCGALNAYLEGSIKHEV